MGRPETTLKRMLIASKEAGYIVAGAKAEGRNQRQRLKYRAGQTGTESGILKRPTPEERPHDPSAGI